jgi:polyisoprenoid-binding protein YceI
MKRGKRLLIVAIAFIVVGGSIAFVMRDEIKDIVFPDKVVPADHSADVNRLDKGEVTVTENGIEVGSITELNGEYVTVLDSSELFFDNGGTTGVFDIFNVTIKGDGVAENLSINAEIDPASINTQSGIRDGHLQGDEFFNTEKFTSITFQSSGVVLADSGYVAAGTMNFMGMEKDVEISFKYQGKSTYATGATYHVLEGGFNFNAGDFGMPLGTTVDLSTVSFYLEMIVPKS